MHNKMRAGEWFTCLHVLPASDEMNIPVLEKDSSGPMLPERENTTVTLIDILLFPMHMLEIYWWMRFDSITVYYNRIKRNIIPAGKKLKMKKRYV